MNAGAQEGFWVGTSCMYTGCPAPAPKLLNAWIGIITNFGYGAAVESLVFREVRKKLWRYYRVGYGSSNFKILNEKVKAC